MYFLNEKIFQRKLFCMMLEQQLLTYSFFSKLGAYSINHFNKKSLDETTAYTIELLQNPHNGVIIFPQGSFSPQDQKPRVIKKGLVHFTRTTCAQILPVGLRIEWYNRRKPTLLVRFGRVMNAAECEHSIDSFTQEFNSNLDALEASVSREVFVKEFML